MSPSTFSRRMATTSTLPSGFILKVEAWATELRVQALAGPLWRPQITVKIIMLSTRSRGNLSQLSPTLAAHP